MVSLNLRCFPALSTGSPIPILISRRHRSTGDPAQFLHPRRDPVDAPGHFGRGNRPLIFSTELARSAPEQIVHPSELRRGLTATRLQEREPEFADDLVQSLGRSVAVYGMICLRTDGDTGLLAQKIEKPPSADAKWDLHLLTADGEGRLSYRSGEAK
jgi:hypothetical protein